MCDGAYAVHGDLKSASNGVGECLAVSATIFLFGFSCDSIHSCHVICILCVGNVSQFILLNPSDADSQTKSLLQVKFGTFVLSFRNHHLRKNVVPYQNFTFLKLVECLVRQRPEKKRENCRTYVHEQLLHMIYTPNSYCRQVVVASSLFLQKHDS